MSWLDAFFKAYATFTQSGGMPVPQRPTVRVIGGTLTDDPVTESTVLTVGGSGSDSAAFMPLVDPASLAVTPGDATVMANNATVNVKRAVTTTIGNAPGIQGMVVVGASPGQNTTVAVAGIVPAATSGAGSGAAQRLMVNPRSGRPVRIALPRGSEAIHGNVDTTGQVTIAPVQHVGTTPRMVVNICAEPYNAQPDMQLLRGGHWSGGSFDCVQAPGTFAVSSGSDPGDVGKTIIGIGCGNSSATLDLVTTITSVSVDGSTATCAAANAFVAGFTPVSIYFGTENTAAIQAAVTAAASVGHVVHVPWGNYLLTGQITWANGVNMTGDAVMYTPDATTSGGACFYYGGTGNAFLLQSIAHVEWSNIQIRSANSTSQSAIRFDDVYYATFRNVYVFGLQTVQAGFALAGMVFAAHSLNNGFLQFHNCRVSSCLGGGLNIDTTLAFTHIDWKGGAISQNGGWAVSAGAPGAGVSPALCRFEDVDFEGAQTGGITGYYQGLAVVGQCYYESATGSFIYIVGAQYAHNVKIGDGVYIAGWGTNTAPIVIETSAGCQGLIIEGVRSPNVDLITPPPHGRCLASLSGCKRARIGANDSYLPTVDIVAGFGPTIDLGTENVMYPYLLAGPAASNTYSLKLDSAGHVPTIFPSRKCGALGLRCWFNNAPTAGTWKARVARLSGVSGNLGSWTGSVMEITSGYAYPWLVAGTTQLVSFAGTGTALDGATFSIVGIDSTHFTVTGSTNVGSISNFTIIQILRDTGSQSGQVTETFSDSGGNAPLYVEDQQVWNTTGQVEGFAVELITDGSFTVPSNTVFVAELTLGYQGASASEQDQP